jgi:hypothetical protein
MGLKKWTSSLFLQWDNFRFIFSLRLIRVIRKKGYGCKWTWETIQIAT